MIQVDQTRCVGCGACIDACPQEAITLEADVARIDTPLCDDCAACIAVCPEEALAMVAEPSPEMSLVVHQPRVDVVDVPIRAPTIWRRAVLPAVAGVLGWVGREIVPRVAPLALDVLDGVLDYPRAFARGEIATKERGAERSGQTGGRRQRRRRRRGTDE
jgi:Fe-S-cluster-containing hydrogenase component 2